MQASSPADSNPADGERTMASNQYGNPQPTPLLGRYYVESILWEGGFGVRYKAFDPQLNRPIAVETLGQQHLGNPSAMQVIEKRFNREIEAGARVGNHPHLVQVYDLVHDERQLPYLLLGISAGRYRRRSPRLRPSPPSRRAAHHCGCGPWPRSRAQRGTGPSRHQSDHDLPHRRGAGKGWRLRQCAGR